MAYEKINWLNSNETGKKPINKTNLNHMDDGIADNDTNIGTLSNLNTTDKSNLVGAINEALKKDIMSLSMTTDHSVTVTNETVLNFNQSTSVGNKLTFNSSNHSIKIGANVSKIKVNFNAFAKNATTDWVWFKINKNGTFANISCMVGK